MTSDSLITNRDVDVDIDIQLSETRGEARGHLRNFLPPDYSREQARRGSVAVRRSEKVAPLLRCATFSRRFRGADRDRTDDLRLAKPALSQLSYSPDRSGPGQS